MELDLQYKIKNTKNYYNYLKENGFFKCVDLKKYLAGRISDAIVVQQLANFSNFVKDKYGLRVTDKISKTIDNIDLISTLLSTLK